MEAKEKKKKEEPKTKTSKSTSKKITLREGETLKELSEKTEIKSKDFLEMLRPKRHSISVNGIFMER